MAIETHSSFLLSFGQLCSSFFPSNVIVNDCSCRLITRFRVSPPNLHKIPRLFHLRVSAFGFHELLLHLSMNPVYFFFWTLSQTFSWMILITAWTVSRTGEGCRTWSRADNKKLSTIILSWVVFCVWNFNRNFIRATVKAAFLFFLSLPFSSKRAWESVAYFLEKPLVKSEKVDEWLSDKWVAKAFHDG